MRKNILHKSIVALSRMVGQYNPKLLNHHSYVAYLSYIIGKEMHLDERQLQDLVIAASLHDIGLLSFSEKDNLYILEESYPATHSLVMFILFSEIPYFYNSALIVRHHHVNYNEIKKYEMSSNEDELGIRVPIGSFILRLADRISVSFLYDKPILEQVENNISEFINQIKYVFNPEVLDTLEKLYKKDYVWLEMNSMHPEQLLIKTLRQSIKNEPQEEDFFQKLSIVIGQLIDFKSSYTAGHSNGVSATINWIVENSKINCKYECDVQLLGLLHDIGKLAIPLSILEKPGKLNPKEWSIMRGHAFYSHVALEPLYEIFSFLENAPLHHEKLDGTGYPFGMKNEDLEPCAKALTVADIFTALTEDRPYRGRMSQCEVTRIMKTMSDSGKIDKDITDLILTHYDEVYECRNEGESISRKKYNEFREKINQIQSLES